MNHHKPYHPLTHSLTGILPACATVPGYRYVSPNGENLPCGIKGSPSILPKPTANYSLLTTNSPFPFSAPVALSLTPPPFRHTPSHPRPRPAAPVWRNLQQNLQHAPNHYSSFIIYHSSLSFTFSAKERDPETGLSYFGSRYYSSDLSVWLSVDPMADKYPSLSSYTYCANNPVKLVDSNGEEWTDIDGHIILDHSKIKVYIFYDPESFKDQSEQMYHDAVKLYGKDAVAMSNVTTEKEFAQDWKNMLSTDIREVNLNYHGNSQTLTLDYTNNEYVTATGDGKTNKYGNDALNVQDLPKPLGNITNAQLNINSCESNNTKQKKLRGSKQTLMQAFRNSFDFYKVRGTSNGVSYDRETKQPFPGHRYWPGKWDYMERPRKSSSSVSP